MKLSIPFLLLTLGGLELSHIAEVPVFDQDEYDFDFSDEKRKLISELKEWLEEDVHWS